MFGGNELVIALCFGFGASAPFEFLREWNIVEEGPGIIEFRVPGTFEVAHGLDHTVNLFIAHEREDGRWDTGGIGRVGGIGVISAPEETLGLCNCYTTFNVHSNDRI